MTAPASTELLKLAVRLSHMAAWFSEKSYEAKTLREAQSAINSIAGRQDGKTVWQWLFGGTWHTAEEPQIADPETYARSFGMPVRCLYTRQAASVERAEPTPHQIVEAFNDWSYYKKEGEPVGRMLAHEAAKVSFVAGAKWALALPVERAEMAGEAVTDVRWAVNVLLEKIAERFDKWDTADVWRDEAAALVRSFKHALASLPRSEGVRASEVQSEEATYDRANSVPVAWIAFSGNGNIRLWTSDAGRAKEERERGLDLRAFTLAELVALAARAPAQAGLDPTTVEACAKHLEHEADVATNSLHCGDNSATIAATYRVSRAYHEAAKSIRALALPSAEGKSL